MPCLPGVSCSPSLAAPGSSSMPLGTSLGQLTRRIAIASGASMAIGKEFPREYAKLDELHEARSIRRSPGSARQTHAGPLLETPRDSRDSRIRTIGIDGVWRGVVLAPDSGDTYCLLTVLPPQEGDDFAASHRFGAARASRVPRSGTEELRLVWPHPFAAWRVLAPEPARDRLPHELLRVGPGHRWPRHRQDGDRAAPRGHPCRTRRTAHAPAPRPADHVQRQPGRILPRPARPAHPRRRGTRIRCSTWTGLAYRVVKQARGIGPRRRSRSCEFAGRRPPRTPSADLTPAF